MSLTTLSSSHYINGLNESLACEAKIISIKIEESYNRDETYCYITFSNNYKISIALTSKDKEVAYFYILITLGKMEDEIDNYKETKQTYKYDSLEGRFTMGMTINSPIYNSMINQIDNYGEQMGAPINKPSNKMRLDEFLNRNDGSSSGIAKIISEQKERERLARVEKYKDNGQKGFNNLFKEQEFSKSKLSEPTIQLPSLNNRIISYESSLLLNKIQQKEPNWNDYKNDDDIINKAKQLI